MTVRVLSLVAVAATLAACGPKQPATDAAPKVETEPDVATPDADPGDVVEETTAPVELERPAEPVESEDEAPPTELPREPETDEGAVPLPE